MYHTISSAREREGRSQEGGGYCRRFLFGVAIAMFWMIPMRTLAAQTVRAERLLAPAAMSQGTRVAVAKDTAAVTLAPNAVDTPVSVRVERVTLPAAIPDGFKRVSDPWMIDILNADAAAAETPVKINEPLKVTVRYTSGTTYEKRIYVWNGAKAGWVRLPSTQNVKTRTVTARLKRPYAVVAVLEDRGAVIGKGSWFRHRISDAAASNDYPLGSRLRVTDLETNKHVDVQVISRGPFVHGRVIDLARTAFQKLRPLSQGIVRLLRVEPLEQTT